MSQDQEDIVSASRFPEALVGIFPQRLQRFLIRTYFCNYPQYPCQFTRRTILTCIAVLCFPHDNIV